MWGSLSLVMAKIGASLPELGWGSPAVVVPWTLFFVFSSSYNIEQLALQQPLLRSLLFWRWS